MDAFDWLATVWTQELLNGLAFMQPLEGGIGQFMLLSAVRTFHLGHGFAPSADR